MSSAQKNDVISGTHSAMPCQACYKPLWSDLFYCLLRHASSFSQRRAEAFSLLHLSHLQITLICQLSERLMKADLHACSRPWLAWGWPILKEITMTRLHQGMYNFFLSCAEKDRVGAQNLHEPVSAHLPASILKIQGYMFFQRYSFCAVREYSPSPDCRADCAQCCPCAETCERALPHAEFSDFLTSPSTHWAQ